MFSPLGPLEFKSRIDPSEVSMIADDLAGACDTGIEFLDSVGCVTVVVDSDLPDHIDRVTLADRAISNLDDFPVHVRHWLLQGWSLDDGGGERKNTASS